MDHLQSATRYPLPIFPLSIRIWVSLFTAALILALSQITSVASPIASAAPTPTTTDARYHSETHTAGLQPLARLVDQADLIVRGKVSSAESVWLAEQRQIATVATIQVSYTLWGPRLTAIRVRTAGGFLADRGLGMVNLHAATFAADEEVMLFLAHSEQPAAESRPNVPWSMAGDRTSNGAWQVVDGAAGKFVVQGGTAINHDGVTMEALDTLLANVTTLTSGRVQPHEQQQNVASLFLQFATQSTTHQLDSLEAASVVADKRKWATPHASATYYVNLNSDQISEQRTGKHSADFRTAIIEAADRWSNVSSADFTLRYGGGATAAATGYDGINEILFMHKGPKERAAAAEVWYKADMTVVEADIWINDDYFWDAAGKPAATEVDLESALVHEFGHWLILGHMPEPASIMYPRLATGTVKRELHDEDIAGISTIYPR